MSYTNENLAKAKNIVTERRAKAEADARQRLAKVYSALPELRELDARFPQIGMKIVAAVTDKSGDTNAKIADLRKESEELNACRAQALTAAGFDADYTAPKYFCSSCEDTGYVNGKMCACMRRELVNLGLESSGLGALLKTQSFDNFSLSYYTGADRETMQANLDICIAYADSFSTASDSLLMIGGTGLGKTHLSTSIARKVIEKGFDTQYVMAQSLIADYTAERFAARDKTERYTQCELLIIDDLGTEENSQYAMTVLYNLINQRANSNLPTIINTNLDKNALLNRYAERITSRLFGQYLPMVFPGRDIRMQKLMK